MTPKELISTTEGRNALCWHFGIEPSTMPARHELRRLVVQAVNDPTTLAELITSETRRCGLQVLGFADTSSFPFVSIRGDGCGVYINGIHVPHPGREFCRQCTISQAKAVFVDLLPLPDGANEDAVKALRGED